MVDEDRSPVEPVWVDLGGPDSRAWIVGTQVHLRDRPSLDGEIIAALPWGTRVGSVSGDGAWRRVAFDGLVGYVSDQLLADAPATRRALPEALDADRFCAKGGAGDCVRLDPPDERFAGVHPLNVLEATSAPGLNVRLAAWTAALAPGRAYLEHPRALPNSALFRDFVGHSGKNRQPAVEGEDGSRGLAELFGTHALDPNTSPPPGVFLLLGRMEGGRIRMVSSEGLGVPDGRFPAAEVYYEAGRQEVRLGSFSAGVFLPCGRMRVDSLSFAYDAEEGALYAEADRRVARDLVNYQKDCPRLGGGTFVIVLDTSENREALDAMRAAMEGPGEAQEIDRWGTLGRGLAYRWSPEDAGEGEVVLRRATYGPCYRHHYVSLAFPGGVVDVLDSAPLPRGGEAACR